MRLKGIILVHSDLTVLCLAPFVLPLPKASSQPAVQCDPLSGAKLHQANFIYNAL